MLSLPSPSPCPWILWYASPNTARVGRALPLPMPVIHEVGANRLGLPLVQSSPRPIERVVETWLLASELLPEHPSPPSLYTSHTPERSSSLPCLLWEPFIANTLRPLASETPESCHQPAPKRGKRGVGKRDRAAFLLALLGQHRPSASWHRKMSPMDTLPARNMRWHRDHRSCMD